MAFCIEGGGLFSSEPGDINYDVLPEEGHIAYPGMADRIDEKDKPRIDQKFARRIMYQAIDAGDFETADDAAKKLD